VCGQLTLSGRRRSSPAFWKKIPTVHTAQVDNALESQDAVELASRVAAVGKVVDLTSVSNGN